MSHMITEVWQVCIQRDREKRNSGVKKSGNGRDQGVGANGGKMKQSLKRKMNERREASLGVNLTDCQAL